MKVLLAAIVLIGFGVLGMCFNILFRKNGKFPDGEIGRNPHLRAKGIRCVKEEEQQLYKKHSSNNSTACGGTLSESCSSCGYYEEEKQLLK